MATTAVIAVLGLVSYTALEFFTEESLEQKARAALDTVAGAQENYHLSRGQWATGSDSLANFGERLTVTTGVSTASNVVSVNAVRHQNQQALGLAVLAGTGRCLTLVIFPPKAGVDAEPILLRELTDNEICNGELAPT